MRALLLLASSTPLLLRGLDGDEAALDRVIDVLDRALGLLPSSDITNRATALSNQAVALGTRYERRGDRGDLDAAIVGGRKALRLFPAGHRNVRPAATHLADVLQTRYTVAGQSEDLDEAIAAQRTGLAASAQDLESATDTGNLSTWLRDRFDLSHDPADLAESVVLARRSVAVATPQHRYYLLILSNAANTLQVGFQHTADPSLLDDALTWRRQAADGTTPQDPERAGRHCDLGATLLARYRHAGSTDDLREAVEAVGRALEGAAQHHPRRGVYLANLSATLLEQYRLDGRRDVLQRAIDAASESVRCAFPDVQSRAMAVSNHASALQEAADLTGVAAGLDEAIRLLDEVAVAAVDDPHRAGYLANACAARLTRFYLSGQDGDLDQAIADARQASTTVPEGSEEHAQVLSTLGSGLRIRHSRRGDMADLLDAVRAQARAVESLPQRHPLQGRYHANLGTALLAAAIRLQDREHLDRAITVLREGQRRVVGSRDRAVLLTNLGLALAVRAHGDAWPSPGSRAPAEPPSAGNATDGQSEEDLEPARRALRRAYELSARDDPDRPARAAQLAAVLLEQAHLAPATGPGPGATAGRTVAAEVTALVDGAVAASGGAHYTHAAVLLVAARVHRYRYHSQGLVSDLASAAQLYRSAVASPGAHPVSRLAAAAEGAAWAAELHRWDEAVEGYRHAIHLLPLVAWRGADRGTREWQLGHWAGLACDAAATALTLGDPQAALESVDHGRGVLWSQSLDIATDLTSLRACRPALADRLQTVRRGLDGVARQDQAWEVMLGAMGPASTGPAPARTA